MEDHPRLTDDPPAANGAGQVSENQVTHQLLLNGKPPHLLSKIDKLNDLDLRIDHISKPFTLTEVISGQLNNWEMWEDARYMSSR